ncbi:MAG TPA: glycosyltransferase family 39 protein [Chloroflexota bacterium]|nr:glycosyltransferase family 39 protein [Chloroflexota bacterium]
MTRSLRRIAPLDIGFHPTMALPVVRVPGAVRLGHLTAIAIFALALALYGIVVSPQLSKPYVYDEAAFAFVGEAVAKTGLPYANLGHIGRSGEWGIHGDVHDRYDWGLWHPPLYVFILGLTYKLLGVSETSARLVGVICNLGAAAFVYLTTLRLLGDRHAGRAPLGWAGVAALLYLINPLVVQSALMLDIDGTVLVLLLAALMYISIHLVQAERRRTWLAWLGIGTVVFALTLWAKMTSPWAVPAALLGYRVLARSPWRPWRGVAEVAAIAGAGTLLFLISWWLTCLATGMPFKMPFYVLWVEFFDAAGSSSTWRSRPEALAEMVAHVSLWVSPYLVLLFVIAVLWRLGDIVFGGPALRLRPVDVVLASGGALGLLYLVKLASSFPKYHISMMPMWAVAGAWLLARAVGRLGVVESGVYGLALLGLGTYFGTQVQDRWVLFSDWSFIEPLLLIPAAFGLGFLAVGPLLRRDSIVRQGCLLLLLLLLAWSFGVNAHQRESGGSTAYNYGVSGMVEAGRAIDEVVRPGEWYVAAKEVAWYSQRREFIDQDIFIAVLDEFERRGERWDGTMLGVPVRVLGPFIWDPATGARYRYHFQERYEQVLHEGAYFIFVRRAGVSA